MSKLEKLQAELRIEKERLEVLTWLSERKEVVVVSKGHPDYSYLDKNPYILLGNIGTWSESASKDKIKAFKKWTKGLTDGDIGGFSSPDDSADWAIITVPLADTSDETLQTTVKELRKYCPKIKVKLVRHTNVEF